ncbi:MAG: tRNA pseudouridine(55) synthase TruB [Tepidisphaeraceae bacterium]
MNGFINLDKPSGISSARAVDQVKRLLPRKTKIGHAGTLDPFATGVLVLLIGQATRQCERLMDARKQYEAIVKFGFSTATDDLESPEEAFTKTGPFSPAPSCLNAPGYMQMPVLGEQVQAVLPRFIGDIQQRPPAFSAMKVRGQRAYKLAREGEDVKLEPRTVRVYGIEPLDFAWPLLRLRIDCGRGTYVRAIARDLGEALGVGGYLTQLRRTRVGDFGIEQAITLDRLRSEGVMAHLIETTSLPPQPPH